MWLQLTFVSDIQPQMGIQKAKLTIANLDEQMKEIALKLIKNIRQKNDEA